MHDRWVFFAPLSHTDTLTSCLSPSFALLRLCSLTAEQAEEQEACEISLWKSMILTKKARETEDYCLCSFLRLFLCCCIHPPLWTFKLYLSTWTVDQEQGWHCKAKRPLFHLLWLGLILCSMCWDWRGFFSPWTVNGSHLASKDDSLSRATFILAEIYYKRIVSSCSKAWGKDSFMLHIRYGYEYGLLSVLISSVFLSVFWKLTDMEDM